MINTIVGRYMFREMMPPFVINVMFFTFVFLLTKILEIMNMVVNYKISIFSILLMIIYSMPYFLIFVIPMSVMMAVLLTFLKMSGDNEITALKSGGVSLYSLVPPVMVFSLIGALLTAYMTLNGLPWGRISLKELTRKSIASGIDVGIKERTFNDSFKDVMLYVNKIDIKDRALIDVFIEDQRNKESVITVVAPKGKLFAEPGEAVFHLMLFNGAINQVDLDQRSVNSISFDSYDLRLDLRKKLAASASGPKGAKEMNIFELSDFIYSDVKQDEKYHSALIEFHKKFSIPFACFALGLLAIPLGVQSKSARRSFGLGLGLAFFLLYYLLLSAGIVFGETGLYPPVIGMWVPNVVAAILGLYLLVRTARDNPVRVDIIPMIMRLFKRS